jgi:glycyl-tRNA synthetase beta chain
VPTGEKDPFALRRHALGVLRVLIEKQLPIDLVDLLRAAYGCFAGAQVADPTDALYAFFMDRLRGMLRERGYAAGEIEAVLSLAPRRLDDVIARLDAVREFTALPEAGALAAANKRIANILKKSEAETGRTNADGTVNPESAMSHDIVMSLLVEDAERTLNERLNAVGPTVQSQLARRDYTRALSALAALRDPVDTFFNDVMVNAEDAALRRNRLALLAALHAQMNCVADISKLAA